MKKCLLIVGIELLCVSAVFADPGSPFVFQSGKLSLGWVNTDALATWDLLHVEGITARVGGSVTVLDYDRFGLFMGIAAPSSMPEAVAVMGGPQIVLDDVARQVVTAVLGAAKVSPDLVKSIADAVRFKAFGGYDFRFHKPIAGLGIGKAF